MRHQSGARSPAGAPWFLLPCSLRQTNCVPAWLRCCAKPATRSSKPATPQRPWPSSVNGRQLADTVRGASPATRVLFITGYAESTVLNKEALDEDMQILTKPFALAEFRARVDGIVAGMEA